LFAEALHHHQAGRLHEAERLYRQVLAVDPRHADSLHLLGVAACQMGRHGLAIDLIQQAITLDGTIAYYHSNLGNALAQQGRLEEATACFRKAIALKPDYLEALNNLGKALGDQGRLEEAVACYRRALDLAPNSPAACLSLGKALRDHGGLNEAVACYRRALALKPDFADAHSHLGVALAAEGRPDEAVACFRTALQLSPASPEAHNNLGAALKDMGRPDEAVACHRRALDLKPDYPEAYYNLGIALADQGRLDEAVACYRRALDLKPNYPEAHHNIGVAFNQQARPDAAVACFRSALDLKPDFPEAHNNLGMALLGLGDLAAGFEEHEWRWKTRNMMKDFRTFAQPQWRGEAADGRTLLIHAEQGFGDTLQFCRYAPLAAARGLRVILEVPKPLVRLLRGLPGVDLVLGHGEERPPFDFHCPMLSMPLALRTTLATIPSAESYLHADPAQVAVWRERLDTMGGHGPRIGLVWAGTAVATADRRRSMAPDRLAPLFDLPGLQFFSLQKDGPAAPAHVPLIDFMAEMRDFADTAALIANLDLVISVDTAVVHLAAALGKPVWVLDRFDPCWRWLLGRRDSPWYPTLRLYRQPKPGDWNSVLAEVVRDLRGFAQA
jgi:tetratricopeptide (TPR) repeat protein